MRVIFGSLMVAVFALALGLSGLPSSLGDLNASMPAASETHHDGDCMEHGPAHAIAQSGHCCAAAAAGIIFTSLVVTVQLPNQQETISFGDDTFVPGPLFGIFRPPRHA